MAKKKPAETTRRVRFIDRAVVDEAGTRFEFDTNLGWNEPLATVLDAEPNARLFVGGLGSMREATRDDPAVRAALLQPGEYFAGLYRIGGSAIISITTD